MAEGGLHAAVLCHGALPVAFEGEEPIGGLPGHIGPEMEAAILDEGLAHIALHIPAQGTKDGLVHVVVHAVGIGDEAVDVVGKARKMVV